MKLSVIRPRFTPRSSHDGLQQVCLSDLLGALRAGGDLDLIREGLALVLQALIDAGATQQVGARPMRGASSAPWIATGFDHSCCRLSGLVCKFVRGQGGCWDQALGSARYSPQAQSRASCGVPLGRPLGSNESS